VEVFASGPPSRPHVDVAIIEAVQTHSLNEQGTALMIQQLIAQAAAIGCDGIVLGGTTDHQGASPGRALSLLDPGSTKRQATCVVYDDPPPPPESLRRAKKPRSRDLVPAADEGIAPSRDDVGASASPDVEVQTDPLTGPGIEPAPDDPPTGPGIEPDPVRPRSGQRRQGSVP
jgi:hypothetical protein